MNVQSASFLGGCGRQNWYIPPELKRLNLFPKKQGGNYSILNILKVFPIIYFILSFTCAAKKNPWWMRPKIGKKKKYARKNYHILNQTIMLYGNFEVSMKEKDMYLVENN